MSRTTIVTCDNCQQEASGPANYWHAANTKLDGKVVLECNLTFTNQSWIRDICQECLAACTRALASRNPKDQKNSPEYRELLSLWESQLEQLRKEVSGS